MTTKKQFRKKQKKKQKQHLPAEKAGFPVHKNEVVIAKVTGLGHNGEGVGKVNGFTLFIPGALPGEKVETKVLKVKKQYGYGKLLKLLQPSAARTDAPCPVFERCGGCQLQHLHYEEQLRLKRQMVIDSLERIGKLQVRGLATENVVEKKVLEETVDGKKDDVKCLDKGIIVHPTIGMENPWRYRNKAQVPVGVKNGRLLAGFYASGSHRIIDMDTCLIQDEQNDHAIQTVKELAQELGISVYDEEKHRGLLRHIVVRKGFITGEMMIVLVTNGRDIPHQQEWVQFILEQVPGVVSICQNINMERSNVIFGDETYVLWGRDVIYDQIGDVRFAISARSFYQVNPVQTKVLYDKAVEYAGLNGKETVIDAYCGIGTISLFLSQHAEKVYGVEIVPEAIEDARQNARLNGISNVEFAVGKAEEVMPAWREQGIRADVIVVDPPRKGCDEVLLSTILQMKPKRVVYVSCNPATLARDLRVLEDGGYQTVEVQPVDMFPQTVHVECCVSLVRK